jgi:RNA polymerase sigma-70 factor (ECF subfamily)
MSLRASAVMAAELPMMANSIKKRRCSDDEGVLVAACQRGEREAFDKIVERHQRSVYRLCFRFVNNHEDADDLVQEVFIKAFRGIRRFRCDSSLSTWLYRIAVNACLSFRASKRPPTEELKEDVGVTAPDVLTRIERNERSRRIQEAMKRLPNKQRTTLVLKMFHELKHEDVARIMGTTIGTAKANHFHALTIPGGAS